MTEQEKLARQWAEKKLEEETKNPGSHLEEAVAAAEYILEHTTPETMADVEWDDEKHYLAGATLKGAYSLSSVVVMHFARNDGAIDYTTLGGTHGWAVRKDLTPNGKRYKLVEVSEPDHPEVLATTEDYENAPNGTIVTTAKGAPSIKVSGGWWDGIGSRVKDLKGYGLTYHVLRWGWGDDA